MTQWWRPYPSGQEQIGINLAMNLNSYAPTQMGLTSCQFHVEYTV